MFCSKCGANIPENVDFCSSCGQRMSESAKIEPKTVPNAGRSNKLHCPQCKSHNISITTESSIDGAITTSYGRSGRVSGTKVSNTHRNYWICGDCGTKFRNIQNLEEEINKKKNLPIVYTIFSIISLIATIYFIINIIDSGIISFIIFGSLTFGCFIASIVFFCFIFSTKSKLKKMREELEYLKHNCFN